MAGDNVRMKVKPIFRPGDFVIYRMTKHSQCPGPRAKQVAPSPFGEEYKYQVDKYWIVDEVREDGQVLLRTRRGKTRVMRMDDLNLRPASWWQRLLYRNSFPQPHPPAAAGTKQHPEKQTSSSAVRN